MRPRISKRSVHQSVGLSVGPSGTRFLSTTEFTILSRTIGLQGWVSDVGCRMSDVPSFFVHDGIYNSVADYRSSRVGVGCRMSYVVCRMLYVGCRMSDVPSFFFFHDGITFERFELQS